MTDDLVAQLRWLGDHASFEPHMHHTAADRIEKLEAEIGVLFAANVRLNSRADLDSDHYANRTEKLETALKKIAYDVGGEYGRKEMMSIAQSAIRGKDD
jgi:hypothetical protein